MAGDHFGEQGGEHDHEQERDHCPLTMLAPAHWAEMMSPTSGAMSPDPLIVNAPADRCCQVEAAGTVG